MVEKNNSDNRFTKITNCKIIALYEKLPSVIYRSHMIELSYKYDDDDLFHERKYITIDQTCFLKELDDWFKNGEKDRLYYTDGMGDIDIFKLNDEYVLYYSPNDNNYQYYHFNKEEFHKLKNWLKIENK